MILSLHNYFIYFFLKLNLDLNPSITTSNHKNQQKKDQKLIRVEKLDEHNNITQPREEVKEIKVIQEIHHKTWLQNYYHQDNNDSYLQLNVSLIVQVTRLMVIASRNLVGQEVFFGFFGPSTFLDQYFHFKIWFLYTLSSSRQNIRVLKHPNIYLS